MNTARLLDLALRIREVPDVDMVAYTHVCGSPSCVLGWMPAFYPYEWKMWAKEPVLTGSARTMASVKFWFGINENQVQVSDYIRRFVAMRTREQSAFLFWDMSTMSLVGQTIDGVRWEKVANEWQAIAHNQPMEQS